MMASKPPILKAVDVTKTFPGGIVALDRVSLDIYPGECTVILGENGSGKSTFVKILYGIYTPDSGSIYMHGKKVTISKPLDAIKNGIIMVSQIPQLIDRLTVAENLSLSLAKIGLFNRVKHVEEILRDLSDKTGIRINPTVKVWSLTYTQKQLVEIARAILLGAHVLILDEALTYLPLEERKKFYTYLKELRDSGKAIILITHKIPEALEIADRIYILRRGRLVGSLTREEANPQLIRELMFGEAAKTITYERFYPPYSSKLGDTVIQVKELNVLGDYGELAVRNVSLSVREGEIVGIAGIVGNGQKELLEAIAGLREVASGTIKILGVDVTNRGVRIVRDLGVSFIPDQPMRYAVSPDNSIIENITALFSRKNMIINWTQMSMLTKKLISGYSIYPPQPDMNVKLLSGGNIMKVVVSKELEYATRAIVAYNPTRGLDEATSVFVRRKLVEKAMESRLAVLVASEDLDEILQLSDVVYVMNRGVLYGPFDPVSTPRSKIEEAMVS